MSSDRRQRNVPLALGAVVCGTALGLGTAAVQTPEYRATSGLFVQDGEHPVLIGAQSTGEPDPAGFSAQVADSYRDVATTPLVLDRVIRDLRLHLTSTALAQRVRAERPSNSRVISVQVTDTTAAGAAAIADDVAEQVVTSATQLAPSGEANTLHLTASRSRGA